MISPDLVVPLHSVVDRDLARSALARLRAGKLDRRWCTWPGKVESTPVPKLLCHNRRATDGVGAFSRQHPVQHCHAHGRLGLLGGKAAGSQPWSDQRFVAAYCRFDSPNATDKTVRARRQDRSGRRSGS